MSRRLINLVAILLACLAGCRLTGEGPVSRSLITCRQLSQRGVSALERQDVDTAESLLSQAVTACPVDAEARRHYAEALWQKGDQQKAIGQVDEALRLANDDGALHVRAAQMRLAVGDVEGARREAALAIELDPKSGAAWKLRGDVLRRSGQPRQALADYHRALSYLPENRDVLLALAETYRTLGEPQRALANLQSLADTYPSGEEPQQVFFLQGLALAALGRPGDAAESFVAARQRGQPTPELLYHLAAAEAQAGRENEARQNLQQALAIDPAHGPSRELLGRLEVTRR